MEEIIIKNLQNEHHPFVLDKSCYTYGDLRNVVASFQTFLINNNLNRVMICLPQGFYAYAMEIAAYLSGVEFCSVNENDPFNRKSGYITEYNPDCLVVSELDRCSYSCKVVYIEKISINASASLLLGQRRVKNPIAYVCYTSGTTGTPKGVAIYRTAFEHAIKWIVSHFGLVSDDICSQYPNLNFDMSLVDIFSAVLAGASLVPFRDFSDKMFPARLIKKYRITFWNSVPHVIDILIKQKKLNADTLGTIKKFKFGGGEIFPRHMEEIFKVRKDAKVFLSYGPTEVTLFCCCLSINANNYTNYARHNMSLGVSLPGWNVILFNTATDGIGEIIVYGDNIGLRYIGKANDNSNFTTIEVGEKTYRAYRTGDFGKIIDGNLYFICRKDMQVKINGNRVDLSEIDRVLRAHGVIDATTVFYNNRIITFYVSKSINENKARQLIAQNLPRYMNPYRIIRMKDFPINNNGKVDRAKLIERLK